ncbi:MAG: hypothetical protein BroJett024_41880 [Alphaproteobacteria bacterium]|nr:MAG: hypothetical protein BroJett024_41880 [Alphaproteobacteria bacterium]
MCVFLALESGLGSPIVVNCHDTGVLSMKKVILVAAAVLTLVGVAGCTTVGKAPIGKAPVVTKG